MSDISLPDKKMESPLSQSGIRISVCLRGCIYEGHGLECVVDEDGVIECLVRVLDCVQEDVLLDRRHLDRQEKKWHNDVRCVGIDHSDANDYNCTRLESRQRIA